MPTIPERERQKATLVELARRALMVGSPVALFEVGSRRHDPEFARLPRSRFRVYASTPRGGIRPEVGLVLSTKGVSGRYTNKNGGNPVIYSPRVKLETMKEVVLESCANLPTLPQKTAPSGEVLEFKATSSKKNGAGRTGKYTGAERRIAQKTGLLARKERLVKKLEAINAELAEIAILENARAILVAVAPKKRKRKKK